MRAHILPLAFALTCLAGPALAEGGCSPADASARILRSPNPNDVHPDWAGGSSVGTSWTLETSGRVKKGGVAYLKGDLYSPRGDLVNRGVYVVAGEWECEE